MVASVKAEEVEMAETGTTAAETAPSSRMREESPLSEPPGEEYCEQVEAPKPIKKQRAKRKATKPPVVEGEVDDGTNESPKKKRRRKTPEEDKVYDMSPIENVLSTTFKGQS